MTDTPKLHMRPSRVQQKLRAGEAVHVMKLNIGDSRVIEIAAMAGYDCMWTDMEHVPNDWGLLERQVLAAKAYGADMLVRTARGGYHNYIKPLELDASGIMVPHIMSLEDAKQIVRLTRFHPIGRRPADGGNADGAFCGIDFLEYIAQANTQRFVCIQIEDPEPLDELEEIVALEGIDIIFFGPGDFTHGIGAPGQFDHPLVHQTRRRIAELCVKHGKFAGTVGGPAMWPELLEMGYRFLSIGADVIGLAQYYTNLLNAFREAVATAQV